ncbi:hypothetical protein N9273_00100 [bacterium]|nr:hypothetical protein [bacterium]
MKSKLNDAELIAEAYTKVEVQEEMVGALAGGIGRVAAAVVKSPIAKRAAQGAVDGLAGDEESDCSMKPQERINHHDDSEIQMAKSELYKIEKYAATLGQMLDSQSALEGWTASKITKAADYLGSVFHKLDYDINGHSMNNTGHEDTVDSPVIKVVDFNHSMEDSE